MIAGGGSLATYKQWNHSDVQRRNHRGEMRDLFMSNGLKENELRELATCRLCKEKIGTKRVIDMYVVNLERHFIDFEAIARKTGLELMMNGNVAIADELSPNEDMTKLVDRDRFMICPDCLYTRVPEFFKDESTEDDTDEHQGDD